MGSPKWERKILNFYAEKVRNNIDNPRNKNLRNKNNINVQSGEAREWARREFYGVAVT